MSHHQYNRYASGKPSSTQRQYEHLSVQSDRDHQWGSCHGPGSSYSSSGASSARGEKSDRSVSSLLSPPVSYRPDQSRSAMDDVDERSVEMHTSRAREEVKGFSKQHSLDQDTRFTGTQRTGFHSTGTGMTSYPLSSPSVSVGHRHPDVDSDGSSWSSSYKRPTSDNSEFYSSSSFKYTSSGDSRQNVRSEREGGMHSVAGSKDYEYTMRETSSASTSESSKHKYTPESAADILLFFGLEKEDLEDLKSYPEDQLTPGNLPFILRQIRIKKGKTPAPGNQKKPYLDPRATSSGSGLDSHSLSTSVVPGVSYKGLSSSGPLQSKVIDYGHVSRYTGHNMDDVGRTSDGRNIDSGSMLLMDPYSHSRNQQEPLQKDKTEMKSASLGASHNQDISVTSQSSSYRSVLNSGVPQTHPLQHPQDVFSPYSLKNDTNVGGVKSEASKPAPLKEPEAHRQPTKPLQPTFKSNSKGHGMSQSVTGVVLFDSKNRDTKTQSMTQVQVPTGGEQFTKQQAQQQTQQQAQMEQHAQQHPVDQHLKQKSPLFVQQLDQLPQQNQPAFQPGQATWIPAFSSARSVSHTPGLVSSPAVADPVFIPRGPPQVVDQPSVLPQPINFSHPNFKMVTNTGPTAEKAKASTCLPTSAMMYDYAATSPKSFPHTCSLCNTECRRLKVSGRLHSVFMLLFL